MAYELTDLTPATLIAEAYDDVQSLTDEGVQLHRRAVQGRGLVVHVHGWDRWAFNGQGGRAVSLRVEGQYMDRARAGFRTTSAAEAFAAECREMLATMPVPVLGDAYSHPRRTERAA